MKASIVIGANYGDEGKGTVVARLTRDSEHVLNILTNGGSQRGHSILTKDGSMTFQHFGSGTYHGADSYYGPEYVLNPMQFVKEYKELIRKPDHIYRDRRCRWSTPYDVMSNLIDEEQRKRKASCGMGIWFTIRRCNQTPIMLFDDFMAEPERWVQYLVGVRSYYERLMTIPDSWRDVWQSEDVMKHFIKDCMAMETLTEVSPLSALTAYEHLIFENGQGLLLSDTGRDTADTTPSDTGIQYGLRMARECGITDITAHYVTRPYLTRHGDGEILDPDGRTETVRRYAPASIREDRTNHYNDHQGEFRYGWLNIPLLRDRIIQDARGCDTVLEVTHCDEWDREVEFRQAFDNVICTDKAEV